MPSFQKGPHNLALSHFHLYHFFIQRTLSFILQHSGAHIGSTTYLRLKRDNTLEQARFFADQAHKHSLICFALSFVCFRPPSVGTLVSKGQGQSHKHDKSHISHKFDGSPFDFSDYRTLRHIAEQLLNEVCRIYLLNAHIPNAVSCRWGFFEENTPLSM